MNHADILGQTLALPCGVTLPNRFGKSAMSEALGTIDNHVTPKLERLYGRWAQVGTGLVLSLIFISRCRPIERCRFGWSRVPYIKKIKSN